MKRCAVFLIFLIFILAGCASPDISADNSFSDLYLPLSEREVPSYTRKIVLTDDVVSVYETDEDACQRLRIYRAAQGDTSVIGRLQHVKGKVSAFSWASACGGKMRYFDKASDAWVERPIAEGEWKLSMVELTFDDGRSFLIYLPKTYRQRKNQTLEYLPQKDGALRVSREDGEWIFYLMANLPDRRCVSDFTLTQGLRPMLNWENSNCGNLWKYYTMETEGKWCFDGYYWPCPYNYVPTGENLLYCCNAAYLIKSFAYPAAVHPAAENLALAMLDTMSLRQNAEGYWPTNPKSEWLYTDYGTETDFYDTRFNAELVEIYRVYYTQYGGDVFLNAMRRYADFFLDFAERTHFDTPQGGWFIPDYGPFETKPHCSLNHLLAQCIEMYELSDILQRPELEKLADRMLLAVRDTKDDWIRENGDLHYCIYPDGSYGLDDYPYLTYNDLFDIRKLLEERSGKTDDAIVFLMDAKRAWMDANGVTEYQK